MRVLVTGLSGLIGSAVRGVLEKTHTLTALNRRAVQGVPTAQADIADLRAIAQAFEGVDAVLHLAAKAGETYSWKELRDTNVEGTRNVFQAAVDAGVQRVVFASSGATVAGWEQEEPYASLTAGRYESLPAEWPMITVAMPPRPRGIYGSTKVWGEALARHYADASTTSFVNVRIGLVNAEDAPTTARQRSVWCSQRDVVAALLAALEAPADVRCETFFAGSNNRYGYRDLAHGKERIGFVPMDGA